MATGYIRYQKLQKCYLGQPIDPPEYKKGDLISSDVFLDLDECENIYKWVKLDRVMCFDENDTDITVKPLKKYTPLYAASDSPVSVMDAVAGDKVYYNPTTEKIVIVSKDETYENGTIIGKVAVPASHYRYGSNNCCSIVGTNERGYLAFSDVIANYGSEGIINRTFDFPEYLHNWYYYEGIDCGKWEDDPFNEDKLVYPDPYGNSCDRVAFESFWDGFYPDPENDSVFMWNNITYDDNWESLATICDSDGVGCYGCAEYCYKFKTEGTTNGNWYFPSAYEILYLYAKMNTYGNGLSLGTPYYSSTKRDMSHSVRFNYTGLSSGRGSLDSISDTTSDGARVIPFAKLYQE